jgi:hypothetical protein
VGPLEPAARYIPPLAVPIVPLVAGQPFDLWWVLFVPLGLVLGWMARAGRMVNDSYAWPAIKKDLIVSILIGGANAVLAGLLIWWWNLAYLPGTGVAFACSFGGVSSINDAWLWARRHISDDAAGEARQEAQRHEALIALQHKRDLEALAERIDRLNEKDGQ